MAEIRQRVSDNRPVTGVHLFQ